MQIEYNKEFLKTIGKIRDASFREKVVKQVEKIIENPETGKPMKYDRKGTREIYVGPFRLAYAYVSKGDKLIFLEIYHKDEQ